MTTGEKQDKKLDLIAQLLAKAERTTPEEAEALTEHAERLMLKYGIEQARIDERRAREGKSAEKIVESRIIYSGTYAAEQRELGINVAFGLGTLRPMQAKTSRGDHVLYLVGFESDVEQAQVLIASLQVQGMVAMRDWWQRNREEYRWETDHGKKRARWGFLRGFGVGAGARIRDNRQREVVDAGSGTDLVLASRRGRVDAHVDGLGLGEAKPPKLPDEFGYGGGYRAGQEANTGEKAVDGRSRALAAGSAA